MELMLPEARHHRSASEHLLRTANDLTKTDIPSGAPEDDDDGKFEVAVSRPVSEPKVLKSALKKPVADDAMSPQLRSPPEAKPSKPRKLTVDEKQTVVKAVGTVKPEPAPLSPKETPLPEEKKFERAASTKQADAAAGLAAKMAAKLASKKALVDNTPKPATETSKPATDTKPATETTSKPAVMSTATLTPKAAAISTATVTKPSEAKEDPLPVPPENRPMTKSIADGRPRGDTDKPNKPAKPGRARGTTGTTTSPTQTASP